MVENGFLTRLRRPLRERAVEPTASSPLRRFKLDDDCVVFLGTSRDNGEGSPALRVGRDESTSERLEYFFYNIMSEERFRLSTENTELERIQRSNVDGQLLSLGPFLVDWLLLAPASSKDDRLFDWAARLSRFLVRYWSEQEARGDDRAMLILPFARRIYWRALGGIVESVECHWRNWTPNGDYSTIEAAETAQWKSLQKLRHESETAWLKGWLDGIDLKEEYARARNEWQADCLNDDRARFFIETLCSWLGYPEDEWQQLREEELRATVWRIEPAEPRACQVGEIPADQGSAPVLRNGDDRECACGLGQMAADQNSAPVMRNDSYHGLEGRTRLHLLIDAWFLPRYDFASVRALRSWLGPDDPSMRPVRLFLKRRKRWLEPYGCVRLWVGIGVGYLVTMFQLDTWDLLLSLVTSQWLAGIILAGILVCATLCYLTYGIKRGTGLPQASLSNWRSFLSGLPFQRAWAFWLRGQVFAVVAGFLCILLIGQVLNPDLHIGPVPWSFWNSVPYPVIHFGLAELVWWRNVVFIVVLYAQVALFIGVFTQLFFDDRPSTAPLAAP